MYFIVFLTGEGFLNSVDAHSPGVLNTESFSWQLRNGPFEVLAMLKSQPSGKDAPIVVEFRDQGLSEARGESTVVVGQLGPYFHPVDLTSDLTSIPTQPAYGALLWVVSLVQTQVKKKETTNI